MLGTPTSSRCVDFIAAHITDGILRNRVNTTTTASNLMGATHLDRAVLQPQTLDLATVRTRHVHQLASIVHAHVHAVLGTMPAAHPTMPPRLCDKSQVGHTRQLDAQKPTYLVFEPHEVVTVDVTHHLALVNRSIGRLAQSLATRERK
jgi:hypothetical protein